MEEDTAHSVRIFIVVSTVFLNTACDHIGDKTRGLIISFSITDVDPIYDDVPVRIFKVFTENSI